MLQEQTAIYEKPATSTSQVLREVDYILFAKILDFHVVWRISDCKGMLQEQTAIYEKPAKSTSQVLREVDYILFAKISDFHVVWRISGSHA
jgi:hypothetical protein